MLAMEDVLCELSDHEKRNEQGLPPGFRFHPTDEELITFYLASKVFNGTFTTTNVKFAEVDLNRCEPWELPDVAKMGEREWYLFSLRDKKYPTGLRTNRATGAGYWKATGKDKEVYSASSNGEKLLLGMKKTLVFYKGRAPRGEKTRWVMHEYRLDGHFSISHHHTTLISKEEWVICRIFHKSGEKKVQGHLNADSPSPTKSTTTLPPPLSLATTPTNSLTLCQSKTSSQHHSFQNDSDHLFPFQPACFPYTRDHHPSSEVFFKTQLSQQVKEQFTTPKRTKIETTTVLHDQQQLVEDANYNYNLRWMDNKLNSNPSNFQNLFPLEIMDATGMMLDVPIGMDSWSQAQHV